MQDSISQHFQLHCQTETPGRHNFLSGVQSSARIHACFVAAQCMHGLPKFATVNNDGYALMIALTLNFSFKRLNQLIYVPRIYDAANVYVYLTLRVPCMHRFRCAIDAGLHATL